MSFRNVLQRKGRLSQQKRDQLLEYANIIGVNYADSIYTMAENQSPYAKNVDFGDPIGCFTKRKGYESLITSLGAGKVLGLNNWQHSVGDKMLMAWGNDIYLLSGDAGSVAKTSKTDWDAGTYTDTEGATSPGDIIVTALAGADFTDAVTLDADFTGTHSNTEATGDSVSLTKKATSTARLYFQNAAAGYTPTKKGTWAIDKLTVKALGKVDTGASANSGSNEFSTNDTIGLFMGVSEPLPANKTISGNITAVIKAFEESGHANIVSRLHIWVTQGDSSTLRGTLFSNHNESLEWPTKAGNVSIASHALNSVSALAGDRIVVEVGGYCKANPGNNYTGAIYYGTGTSYIEFSVDPFDAYNTPGTYTHPVLDISTVGYVNSATITYNTTLPANTAIDFQIQTSADSGVTWSGWESYTSGTALFAIDTDITGYRLQWRAILSTTDVGKTPKLDDVTVSIVHSAYKSTGIWVSPVYDLTKTPTTTTLGWTETIPVGTSTKWYVRSSSNGTIFGDWKQITSTGDSAPSQRYLQVMVVLTPTLTDTPTASSFILSYSVGYGTTHKIDISPLGRVDNKLSGNSVCFCNYEDWCLVTDGLRPFLLYITDNTQEADTAQAGGASTITLKAGASTVNSHYNNAFITITGGTGEGQTRWISGYDGTTKIATVSVAWTTQPDNTSTYSIGSAIKARNIGVDPPTTAPSGVADVAGNPNGAYKLMVTYVNADGVESNPSAASALVTVSSKKILWTIPVDTSTGNTTAKRRLYRTAAGGAVYKYLAEVADNTTATYLDNTADIALGSLMLDNNNVPPSTCTLIYTFTSYVFYVTEGYYVRFSKPGAPDQCPYSESDVQEISFPDEVLDIKSSPVALVFGGENFLASVTSNGGFIFDSDPNIDTTTMKVVDTHGGMSYRASAMCISPNLNSCLVVNTNVGLRSIIPGLQDDSVESVPFSKNMQKYYDRSINRHQAAAIFHNNYYIYSFEYMAEDASESEYLTFAYDFRTEQWNGPWTFGMSCYTIQGNDVYAGDNANGKIYKMFTGNTDAGAAIEMECDLPMKAPGTEAGTCKFKRLMAIVHSDSTTSSTIIKPKVDEAECTVTLGTLATTFTGDERPGHDFIRTRKYGIGLPRGHTYSLRIVDDSVNPLRILKVITEYEVLPLRN